MARWPVPEPLDEQPEDSLPGVVRQIQDEKGWTTEKVLLLVLVYLGRIFDSDGTHNLLDHLEDQE
jgi:hypothetical protein